MLTKGEKVDKEVPEMLFSLVYYIYGHVNKIYSACDLHECHVQFLDIQGLI